MVYSLLAAQASPDIADEDTGRTPLFYAVVFGRLEFVRMLLKRGANKNARDIVRGEDNIC